MTIKGTIRGKMIELFQPLPFPDGQEVTVSILPESPQAPFGSPQVLLDAVRRPPHVDPADVDELERAIEAGKIPVCYKGAFDEDEEQ